MALSERIYGSTTPYYPKPYEVKTKAVWHGYLLSEEEKQQIDLMMGRAMLDQKFCDRLVRARDEGLFAEYRLSRETRRWLCSIPARSLSELAEAITFD